MDNFLLAITVVLHPAETFRMIKIDRKRISLIPPICLILLAVVIKIIGVNITHFPLTTVNPWETSIFQESVTLLVPLLSWIITCYAITSIFDGESYFKEIVLASALCLIPYIIFSPFIAAISSIISLNEIAFYAILNAALWIWILALFFSSVMVMNNYSLGKTILVVFITLVSIVIFWAICSLIYALINQLVAFIQDVITEIKINIQ